MNEKQLVLHCSIECLCNNIEFIDEPELKPAEYKRDGFF